MSKDIKTMPKKAKTIRYFLISLNNIKPEDDYKDAVVPRKFVDPLTAYVEEVKRRMKKEDIRKFGQSFLGDDVGVRGENRSGNQHFRQIEKIC